MPPAAFDLIRQRLRNQKLSRPDSRTPADLVAWLGAVQAQDYPSAKWGLGLRASRLTDADVEQAFTEGTILRTHVMRPTWHFVTPADIRWMLALAAPRVHALMAPYNRTLELDARTFARSHTVVERALRGGTHLTRTELAAALARAGITASGQRLGHLMLHAELEALVCSGPRRGKQFTYALLEERVPRARTLTRDEALAELTTRYFTSHGPATVHDFAWWSGLTVGDARRGLDAIASRVRQETVGDLTCWFVPSRAPAPPAAPTAHLLPNYDEYGIAYKHREVMALPRTGPDGNPPVHDPFAHLLIVDGRFAGGWKRTPNSDPLRVHVVLYQPMTQANTRALAAAVERYATFLGVPVTLSTSTSTSSTS